MTEKDRREFSESLEAMCAVYSVEPTMALATGYWIGLEDMELGEVRRAIYRAIRQGGKFMPRPAELRELSGEATPATRAVHAWAAVKQAISKVGAYQSVEFDDPIAAKLVRMLGGWVALCSSDTDELNKWTSQRFIKLYQDMVVSGQVPDNEPLRGLHAIDAAGKQLPEPKPVPVAIAHTPVAAARKLKLLPEASNEWKTVTEGAKR